MQIFKEEGGSFTPRVHLLCTGLERVRRGYESFAKECFAAYKNEPGFKLNLFKGSGISTDSMEIVLKCLYRDSPLAHLVSRMTFRSSYHWEQWTFYRRYLRHCLRHGFPDLVYSSDANLLNFLSRWRKKNAYPFRILFSNGGPVNPPFPEYDHIQQVAAPYLSEAIDAGESSDRQSLVPYGVHIPDEMEQNFPGDSNVTGLKRDLGIPSGRSVVLSVGNISPLHKRMDHVIKELALIPQEKRPFLVLLGGQDITTTKVRELAVKALGDKGFKIATCSADQVKEYYCAADLFVLASIKEGFGRVYLEALMHGLPVIAHNGSVMRYVLGNEGFLIDMEKRGELADKIAEIGYSDEDPAVRTRRRDYVARNFSWEALRDQYEGLFQLAASVSLRG